MLYCVNIFSLGGEGPSPWGGTLASISTCFYHIP